MESSTSRATLLGLFKVLTTDTKTLVRQEIALAKTELTEKLSKMGKQATTIAIGGSIAYAGLIVLLTGLGWLLAYAFEQAGLSDLLAAFLGLFLLGLIVAGVGGFMVMGALKSLKQESLAPEKTIETLKNLKETPETYESSAEGQKPTSDEIQGEVYATEGRVGETLDELGYRLSPRRLNAQLKHKIQEQPYRLGAFAMIAGVVSGLLLMRKARHS